MPLENIPSADGLDKDRFFIPLMSEPLTETDHHKLLVLRDNATRAFRDNAVHAINQYFSDLLSFRCFKHMSIDAIVSNCFKLLAVSTYINYETDNDADVKTKLLQQDIRRKNIKNHISMKIKEYIDGKL